jgi:hypothetical protein
MVYRFHQSKDEFRMRGYLSRLVFVVTKVRMVIMGMNTVPTSTAPAAPSDDTAAPFSLIVTNNSSVPGDQYFNVYPPEMVVSPFQPQILIPKTSPPTVTGSAPITMTWNGGAAALALVALQPGQDLSAAISQPIELGGSGTVTWTGSQFTVELSTQGTGSGPITVTVAPGAPALSSVGLLVGSGAVVVTVPAAGCSLTLTPDLTPIVTVQFGTAFVPGPSNFRDESDPVHVTFAGTTATIYVGPDNLIVQMS